MIKRALPGVHQAAEPVVRHHPTGHRVAQETVDQTAVALPAVVVHVLPHPMDDEPSLPNPDASPVRRVMSGLKVATEAITPAPRLEAAVMDAVPVLARLRRPPYATGPTKGAAAGGREAGGT